MTIHGQKQKRHLCFHTVLVFAVIFTTALTAAGLSGNQTGKHTFELRLASHEKVEGWERILGPGPQNTPLWISPEVALTNADIARTYVDRAPDGKPYVGVLFTEEGALKMARLTKSHIGEFLAIMLNGRVTNAPVIRTEITGGRATIQGNFTEEEVESIAKELSGDQAWKPRYGPGKYTFELRLASHEKVEGWERVLGPEPQFTPVWISPEVALTNVDIARAYADRAPDGKPCVGFLLTEDGALKLARLTKSHIGENVAVILDGRVDSVPKIMDAITGGRAIIFGNFTEEEAGSIAEGIMVK
jgi:preprotein translocase subunit SecD